jgi:hypothetical protein
MSRPFFVTGARAKVRLGNAVVAYCTDVSYSVDVVHAVPRVLGMFEGVSVEPISYAVNGTLSVVRYLKGAKDKSSEKRVIARAGSNEIGIIAPGGPPGTIDAGNGIGAMGKDYGIKPSSGFFGAFDNFGGFGNPDQSLNKPRPYESFDPSTFEAGTTFDIEVTQVFRDLQNKDGSVSLSTFGDLLTVNKPVYGPDSEIGIVRIREARFTRLEGAISKKSVLIEKYNFTALYLDGDSFLARPSGFHGVKAGDRFEKGEKGE